MRTAQTLRDRYESIPKRDFKTAVIGLMEREYKILGSHRVLQMLADDIEQLHQTYYPERNRLKTGDIVWQTTKDDGQRPTYGKRTESYGVQTVILPLIRPEDVDRRTSYKKGDRNSNYRHRDTRDIEQMVRLLRSAKEQGGLLSGAELSVLMNRSLATIVKYLRAYFERTGDILPMKGYVLDQGSNPSHKGTIISLYERGVSPADIVLKTGHTQTAVDRYIRTYDQVLELVKKRHNAISICQITGRSINVVRQHMKLVKEYHPRLKVDVTSRGRNTRGGKTRKKH